MSQPRAAGPAAGDCWPTRAQEDLLKAALLTGPEGREAWRRWRARPALDSHARRLLPLALRNLERQGIADPLLPLLRERVRPLQRRSRNLRHDTAEVVALLDEGQGIRTLLLKGCGLAAVDYDEPELRPLGDADVLVPTRDAARACDLLLKAGFTPLGPLPRSDGELAERHALCLRNSSGRILDLHWHVLDLCCSPNADDAFWEAARPATILGRASRALSSADQLLHACVHGLRWSRIAPHRWVADAVVVMRRAGASLDWERLARQASERRLVLPLTAALRYVRQVFGAPVPEPLLARLASRPTGWQERLSFEARAHAPWLRGPLRAAGLHADEYRRARESGAVGPGLSGLSSFARLTWGVRGLWELPLLGVSRGPRRAGEIVRFSLRRPRVRAVRSPGTGVGR